MLNQTPKKILSSQNFLVKHLVKIREERSFRQKEGQVLVMGEKVIGELAKTHLPLAFFITSDHALKMRCETYVVTKEILKKVSGLKSAPSCVALFEMPQESDLKGKKYIVACDKISDPGNLGTLIRSALSFGWEGLFLLDDSVDLFNDKVLRASCGGSLLLPYCRGSLEKLSQFARESHLEILVADLEGEEVKSVQANNGALLLLGTEGSGQRKAAEELGKKITIPMKNMESLNVAVAASILMYALRGQ